MAIFNNFFGSFLNRYKFEDPIKRESESNQIALDNIDGAININPESMSQYMINLDWAYNNQAQLLETYRDIAQYNIVDFAIDDIINEAVSFSEDEEPITLDLSNVPEELMSENIKEKAYDAYEKILRLLNLKQSIHRRFKQFYTDGRLAYQKVINQKRPQEGLVNIIELDARYITKYRQVQYDNENKVITGVEESYIYDESLGRKENKETEKGTKFKQALELNPHTVTYVTSGLTDPTSGYAISWLHKAVKPANQLRMMENALVIYRIVRAPERRIFYVDVSNLPKNKAEQYLRALKNNYRNRMSFDPNTGMFKDDKHLQTMQEDFWLPRNSSGRGTEVNTLPGGQNLDNIADVEYFQKQLYRSLNIPVSRLDSSSLITFGRQTEITRDELKFSRFVSGVRKRFNVMLLDLLKSELILTKVIDSKEWFAIEQYIEFDYALDQYLEEMKNTEMIRDRLELAGEFEAYIGKYVSNQYIRDKILHQTEQEIEDLDKQIEEEKKSRQYETDDENDDGSDGGGKSDDSGSSVSKSIGDMNFKNATTQKDAGAADKPAKPVSTSVVAVKKPIQPPPPESVTTS